MKICREVVPTKLAISIVGIAALVEGQKREVLTRIR